MKASIHDHDDTRPSLTIGLFLLLPKPRPIGYRPYLHEERIEVFINWTRHAPGVA